MFEQVWQCAFAPRTRSDNEYTSNEFFATCGGYSICYIDAKNGVVKTKHYSTDHTEDFTAMAWTSFLTCDGQMNILAVAGKKMVLHLLHPDQAVCFAEHNLLQKKGKSNIESLVFHFHPKQPSILFGIVSPSLCEQLHMLFFLLFFWKLIIKNPIFACLQVYTMKQEGHKKFVCGI